MSNLRGAYATKPEHVTQWVAELAAERPMAELKWLIREAIKDGREHDAKLWTMLHACGPS